MNGKIEKDFVCYLILLSKALLEYSRRSSTILLFEGAVAFAIVVDFVVECYPM